jgi:hypothetical protein
MQLRLALTIAYGAFIGAWAYTDEKSSGGLFAELHSSTSFELFVLVLGIAVGFAVHRIWVLVALLGPLLTLGYLQLTGYISPWHDGTAPLLSPPGISVFFWYGLTLLLGIGIWRLQGNASSTKRGRWSDPGSSSTS